MKLNQVKDILNAQEVLIIDEKVLDKDLFYGFSSDLMSDALALIDDTQEILFLTGLVNQQTLRTAEMLDIEVIIFVRNKIPSDELIEMARKLNINMLSTAYTMYEACGRLYHGGLHR